MGSTWIPPPSDEYVLRPEGRVHDNVDQTQCRTIMGKSWMSPVVEKCLQCLVMDV